MLIAEDGTGLEAANVYADLEHAEAFHLERGTLDAWQAHVNAGTATGGLLRATEFLDARYVWRGVILSSDQGLKLPRQTFLDSDFRMIEPVLQIARAADATSLLALRLLEDPTNGANIASERFPDYQVTYNGAKAAHHPDVDALLRDLYAGGGLGGRLKEAQLVRWS
jgi:hypothetical protein